MGKQLDRIDNEKLRADNKEAVEQWFEKYADPLYTLVYYRAGKDSDTAQDVVQETFLKALEKIEAYDSSRAGMFAWLSYLSKNCIKKTLRDKNRSVPYQVDDDRLDARLSDAYLQMEKQELPPDILERAETADLVRMAMANIPTDYSSVLRQYYYENVPVGEISGRHRISTGAVRTLLHRARRAFKEAFLNLTAPRPQPPRRKG
ncbi:MAG: RNA polymerase sigma factor [Planctomycetota bacterium]|jgi:RNA polymerase sigma-70 factor (ECF subfamily)